MVSQPLVWDTRHSVGLIHTVTLTHGEINRFKDGTEVTEGPDTFMHTSTGTPQRHTLIFRDAQVADCGTYRCVASNPEGQVECTAEVTFIGMYH